MSSTTTDEDRELVGTMQVGALFSARQIIYLIKHAGPGEPVIMMAACGKML